MTDTKENKLLSVKLKDSRAKLTLNGVTLEGNTPKIVIQDKVTQEAINKGFIVVLEAIKTASESEKNICTKE